MEMNRSRLSFNLGLTRCLSLLMPEREKRALRTQVMKSPISQNNSFDAEAKLLRTIGVVPAMLDIGANTGAYSAILEDLIGPGNLYVFEPLPHLHQRLKRRFKKSHVLEFGLSDKQKNQTIRVPYINGKRFDTRATCNNHEEPDQTGFDEFEIRLRPLDAVVKELGLDNIGFVKIDVEGHELEVLEGAVETLARFKPLILIEIETRHHQFPITNIFSKIEGLGYHGYFLKPDSFELLNVSQFDSDRDQNPQCFKSRNFVRYLNNFLFVHESAESDFVAKAVAFLESEKRSA